MERRTMEMDTAAWRMQVWVAFGLALFVTTVGIWFMDADPWVKGYVGVGFYFTISSAFTLAKTLRDQHESEKLANRIAEARAERMLREYGEDAA